MWSSVPAKRSKVDQLESNTYNMFATIMTEIKSIRSKQESEMPSQDEEEFFSDAEMDENSDVSGRTKRSDLRRILTKLLVFTGG